MHGKMRAVDAHGSAAGGPIVRSLIQKAYTLPSHANSARGDNDNVVVVAPELMRKLDGSCDFCDVWALRFAVD